MGKLLDARKRFMKKWKPIPQQDPGITHSSDIEYIPIGIAAKLKSVNDAHDRIVKKYKDLNWLTSSICFILLSCLQNPLS